jgi:DMSO/TMAO reductase YedYZ molybdopterin-dependent catalytic subunit
VIEFAFEGLDRGVESGVEQAYERGLARDVAMNGDAVLAYEMNGQTLPPQHGFPLRLVVPGWYGMTNVKWLRKITALTEPFAGYQNARAYRYRQHEDDEGRPVTTMVPRALMIPPGIPDFLTRARRVHDVPCTIEGKAWSGNGEIDRVQVSDDGSTWRDADLAPAVGAHAWRAWRFEWEPKPGTYRLRCRGRDATGAEQPDAPAWNLGGYANNAVQTVTVEVVG